MKSFNFFYENFIFQKMTNDGNFFAVARRKIVGNDDGIAECSR